MSTSQLNSMADIGFAVPTSASDPAQVAEAAIANALTFCAEKMKLSGPQAAIDELRAANAHAHGYFHYALAGQIAGYLSSLDDEVKAAYLYEYDATSEDLVFGPVPASSQLHMIVWAQRKTEALAALITSIDRALADGFAGRAGLPELRHLLDVAVIDDEDVRKNRGHAALLNSVYQRPMAVYSR